MLSQILNFKHGYSIDTKVDATLPCKDLLFKLLYEIDKSIQSETIQLLGRVVPMSHLHHATHLGTDFGSLFIRVEDIHGIYACKTGRHKHNPDNSDCL